MPISEAMRPFRPYGAALEAMIAHDAEVLFEGPAGTGKSLAHLNKIFIQAENYPGCRILMVRKTRASLTESTMVTFENKVVPEGHKCLDGANRQNRHSYVFPNGSEIVLGGMDRLTRILSTDYDVVYVSEAIELAEDEWETLTTRLRNGRMPYQQIIADTNPDKPVHWLNQRCNSGVTRRLLSRHEDNPALFDFDRGEWTEAGRLYIATLDRLTGARKERFRYGRWASAEGLIFDEWDAAKHLVMPTALGAHLQRVWTVDFGFTNPFVWQSWVTLDDGELVREAEIYKTGLLVSDAAKMIREWQKTSGSPRPSAIVCDHDAEGRATLERELGMATTPAHKSVLEGIQAVQVRLRGNAAGPRLFLMRDALIHRRDAALLDAKKPTCTEEEVDGYVWNVTSGRKKGEEPLKENDHGLDAMRYRVAHSDCKRGRRVGGD